MTAGQPVSCEDSDGAAYHATFLSLPYDIRYLIYEHLFPPGSQVGILAWGDSIKAFLPKGHNRIPVQLLRTCKFLRAEAGAFLYTKYVFNFFGTKDDCLGVFADFRDVMRRYVRGEEVRVQALSNGPHSSTGGICLGVSDAKMDLVRLRGRGQPVEIEDMKREVGMKSKGPQHRVARLGTPFIMAIAVALLAMLLMALLRG